MVEEISSLKEKQVLTGALFSEPMRVETVQSAADGSWNVGLVGVQTDQFRRVTLTVQDLESLSILEP